MPQRGLNSNNGYSPEEFQESPIIQAEKRHHWAIRRVTSSDRDIPVDFEEHVRAFLDSCDRFRQPDFDRSSFLNVD